MTRTFALLALLAAVLWTVSDRLANVVVLFWRI